MTCRTSNFNFCMDNGNVTQVKIQLNLVNSNNLVNSTKDGRLPPIYFNP